MDKYQEMRAFVAVVDAGSFVAAADTLRLSKPSVSRHISDLESRLGVRLLQRTTRRLSLTEEGEIFHARCQELLAGIDDAEAEITSRSGEASGLIRVNAPVTFGNLHLAPLWGEFRSRHPKVVLDITLGERIVDLVEEGYDLAVRIAQLPSSSLISRKLSSTRMVLCASPAYLRRAGRPKHPSDLAGHAILAYSHLSSGNDWTFDSPQGHVTVHTTPWLRCNSGDTCRVGALHHQGIILQPSFLVGDDLRSGALVEVMPRYRAIELDIHAVYPSRKHVSSKVRLMIDFLVDAFRRPRWPQ